VHLVTTSVEGLDSGEAERFEGNESTGKTSCAGSVRRLLGCIKVLHGFFCCSRDSQNVMFHVG
jgi:hypothetical protein